MMTDTKIKAITLFEKSLSQMIAGQPDNLPAWLVQARQTALRRFETLGLPDRQMEAWRFFNLDPILKVPYEAYTGELRLSADTRKVIRSLQLNEDLAGLLVFANGHFVPELSTTRDETSSVVILPLSQAWASYGDLLEKTLTRTLSETLEVEDDVFAELNTGLFTDAAFIYTPPNVQVDKPIQILNVSVGDETDLPIAFNPRALIVAGRSTELKVINTFLGHDVTQYTLTNTVCELILDENAQVNYVHLQDEADKSIHLASTRVLQKGDSRFYMTSGAFGGKSSRQSLIARITGSGAECSLNGVAVLFDFMQNHDHVRVSHEVPHSTSNQLYKNIVGGHAVSEFDGSIFIRKAAQQTDARQLNRNLVLSNDARAYTRPTLKIDADDVKCAHGATIGQLEEEERFYLQSRGLSPQAATAVLTDGFAREVIDAIGIPAVRNLMVDLLHRNLVQERLKHPTA